MHDNFFELGGHSLLGTQIVVRIRDELAVDLSAGALFEAPTIAALSERIDELRASAADDALLHDLMAEIQQLSQLELQAELDQVCEQGGSTEHDRTP